MTFLYIYYYIMTEKVQNLTLQFFLGDLTWNRPLMKVRNRVFLFDDQMNFENEKLLANVS